MTENQGASATDDRKTKTQVTREAIFILSVMSIALIWILVSILVSLPEELGDPLSAAVGLTGVIAIFAMFFMKAEEHSRARWSDC